MPKTNPALSMYRGENGKEFLEHLTVPDEMYTAVAMARAARFSRYIKPWMSVLEYGVALGYNLAALECERKVGYDVHDSAKNFLASKKIKFRWETGSVRSGTFDAVICYHTLEHVTDPWATLLEMRRLLRAGGILLLCVPYEKERRYRRFDPTESSYHLFGWNPQTLGRLVTQAGYKEVEPTALRLFGYDRFAAVVAWRLGLYGPRPYRFLRDALLFIKPNYEISAVLRK